MTGTARLITPPTASVVTVAEVKTMLGITTDADDALLAAFIEATVGTIDAASGGWLQRALAPQTWEFCLDCFPATGIALPFPPVTEVTSVKYDDTAGAEQTLVEGNDYRVLGLGQHGKTSLVPAYGASWPSATAGAESVRIRYVCGYATADMPQAIKSAIALGVKQLQSTSERNLFLSRESIPGVRDRQFVVSDAAGAVITRAIENLLSPFHVWS